MSVKSWMHVWTGLAAIAGGIGCGGSAQAPVALQLTEYADDRAALVTTTTCQQPTWSFANPVPTGNALNAVVAPAPGSLVAVGNSGTIVRSDDGGKTWTTQCSGTTDDLQSVSFVDAQTGWAVGAHYIGFGSFGVTSTVLHTIDGGDTWSRQNPGASFFFRGAYFVDSMTGWVVGDGNLILHTTDGGATWTWQSVASWWSGVFFLDAKTGWLAGSSGILHTTDGGATWTLQSTPGVPLRAVSFLDASLGIAVGGSYYYVFGLGYVESQVVVRTTDGGATWTLQPRPGRRQLRGISPVDANTWIAVGRLGTILRTTDFGDSWTLLDSVTTDSLVGISSFDGSTATVVGAGGRMVSTGDGGATWSTSGITNFLYAVSFADPENGWAVGDGGTIVRTIDGGGTWSPQSSHTTTYLLGVSFADADRGIAVGWGTTVRTDDGGATWIPETTNYRLTAVSMADRDTAIAVGDGVILRTANGGVTWIADNRWSSISLNGIAWVDVNIAVAVGIDRTAGQSVFLRTVDGGAQWTQQRTVYYGVYAVSFLDANVGIAVGLVLRTWRTTDGGVSWTLVSGGDPGIVTTARTLFGVSMVDADHGWGVGSRYYCVHRGGCDVEGLIYKTDNGGVSWDLQPSPTRNVWSAVASTGNGAIVVGDQGNILRTSP